MAERKSVDESVATAGRDENTQLAFNQVCMSVAKQLKSEKSSSLFSLCTPSLLISKVDQQGFLTYKEHNVCCHLVGCRVHA